MVNRPVDYAKELLDEGIGGLKVWTLDFAAHKPDGPLHISHRDLDEGLRPLRAIREALGSDIELALDGHGFFQLAAAMRIARKVRDLDMLWLEDIIRPDSIDTIADLRRQTDVPLAVERDVGRLRGLPPCAGKTGRRLRDDRPDVGGRHLPEPARGRAGPVLQRAGGHARLHRAVHAAFGHSSGHRRLQRCLAGDAHAHIRILYPQLIRESIPVVDGRALPPQAPGIGASWLPEIFERSDAGVRVSSL